jgi:NAD(P)-dependent dehydrogenase (short-subunit alcohol dehydrogenase family)
MSKEMGKGWKIGNVPWQVGRRAVITGANSGIGYYTALELARKGAQVVLACRDMQKGEAALAKLRSRVPGAIAEVAHLDLASLESVRTFAESELALGLPLDLLINNAGVMAPKKRLETVDGFEMQFGTNVLGHFALTMRLMPALIRTVQSQAPKPRVVTVASIAHKQGRLNFEDLQSTKSYSPMGAYRQSKLADLMFSFELARRLKDAGPPAWGVISVAAHPGVASTNLFQAGEYSAVEKAARWGFGIAIGVLLNSTAQGALPTLFAATAEGVQDGDYFGPTGLGETRGGNVGTAEVAPQARSLDDARRLWSECERLTGTSLT